ncbi:prepilin peptidase [Alteromonas sp. 07-89-2]|uniref:prepilin peptidase n=1 Tax=Alteromonas TaxID=226 RepID=UPI00148C7BF4|nr:MULTISPECIES: A24 family peptidase [Alteromonas]MCG8497091.1 A24 family peptidase [Enterobacterales bacterium]MCG7636966.1 A24 family peptidase [Alteromonas sp. CNT1-28]MCG7812366.1 A24 family peptidase [Alteromonas sp. MCA-1]MCZ4241817.1 A24 family peptidase [Alteromonas macleodii]NOH58561.1 prepilin peptidase [Alteromonas sp. 07-89-2]
MDAIISLSQLYPAVFYSLIFLVSLMIGSFLNVVIYRLPIMMERSWQQEYQNYFSESDVAGKADDDSAVTQEVFNLVKPDSTCPSCGHKIRAWENIPVISYLFLKGKCAKCKVGISIRYPLVELFTAIACTFAAYQFGVTSQALWAVAFTYVLVALLFIDLDKMLLPDQLTLPLLWLGLLLSTQHVFVGTTDAIIGAAAGYLSLWSVYWLFKLATGKEGMGYGDFKLLAALGAYTGWQGLPVIILLSSFVGAVAGVLIMVFQNKGKSLAIPFGPYLAVAGWLTLLFKDEIITTYLEYVL